LQRVGQKIKDDAVAAAGHQLAVPHASRWHRISGRLGVPAGLIAALSGIWMLRGYTIGRTAGTQVISHLPWLILIGPPTEGPRAGRMIGAWAINQGRWPKR